MLVTSFIAIRGGMSGPIYAFTLHLPVNLHCFHCYGPPEFDINLIFKMHGENAASFTLIYGTHRDGLTIGCIAAHVSRSHKEKPSSLLLALSPLQCFYDFHRVLHRRAVWLLFFSFRRWMAGMMNELDVRKGCVSLMSRMSEACS